MKAYWWIRDDMRRENNPTLEAALAWRKRTGGLLQAVCFQRPSDAISLSEYPKPLPRTSAIRQSYECACLQSLAATLVSMDISTISVSEDILFWMTKQNAESIFFTYGCAHEEVEEEKALMDMGFQTHGFYSRTLLEPAQVFESPLPQVYTPFRKRTESLLQLEAFSEILPYLGPARLSAPFSPTESQARAHLYTYVAENGPGRTYKARRNGLLQPLDSTKLSAYLSLGLLHPKEVWNRCLYVEKLLGGCEEIYWIRFELLWREYFQWVAYEAGPRLFLPEGLQSKGLVAPKVGNVDAFERWTQGRTGDALVDAAMRELAATGFQSNRARQNAASYWIHDLNQPWRVGAAYFEAMLLDFDAASNWGNWAYLAGVGNDPRPFRKFNTQKQADQYDPDKSYRLTWST